MNWVWDDGGRFQTGFRGKAGDCVTRAIAIATEKPYLEVYVSLDELAKQVERRGKTKGISTARDGVYRTTCDKYLKFLGWGWIPTMTIGSGCQFHLRADELPSGRLIVRVSKHMVAVIDGVIHDTHDPTRDGTRCVYGYWSKKE